MIFWKNFNMFSIKIHAFVLEVGENNFFCIHTTMMISKHFAESEFKTLELNFILGQLLSKLFKRHISSV